MSGRRFQYLGAVIVCGLVALLALSSPGPHGLISLLYYEDAASSETPTEFRIPLLRKRAGWIPGPKIRIMRCKFCRDGAHDRCPSEIHFKDREFIMRLLSMHVMFGCKQVTLDEFAARFDDYTLNGRSLPLVVDPSAAEQEVRISCSFQVVLMRDALESVAKKHGLVYYFANNSLHLTRKGMEISVGNTDCPCESSLHDAGLDEPESR